MDDLKTIAGWVVAALVTAVSTLLKRSIDRIDEDRKNHAERIATLEAMDLMTRAEVNKLHEDQKLDFHSHFKMLREDHKELRQEVIKQFENCRDETKELRKDMIKSLDSLHDTLIAILNRPHDERKGD